MKFLPPSSSGSIWRGEAGAWRGLLWGLLLLAFAAALDLLPEPLGRFGTGFSLSLAGMLVGVAWLSVVRFVYSATWGRRFWWVVLLAALLFALLLGTGGVVAACFLSGCFLTLRRYRCWRLVSDRRRAVGFGLGLVALVLVFAMLRFWRAPAEGGLVGRMRNVGLWSTVSLGMFWIWSLFHLAVRMRLHFLRLRPKLAVSAFLIGIVPLFLVLLLGLMTFYTGLGGSRAKRAQGVLENWRSLADGGADLSGALFDTTFTWPEPAPTPVPPRIAAPDWVPRLAQKLASSEKSWADSTGWFSHDRQLWLMRWRGLDTPEPRAQAWLLGQRPLTELSDLLKAQVEISSVGAQRQGGNTVFISSSDADSLGFAGLQANYREVTEASGFADRTYFFGTSIFSVTSLRDDELRSRGLFIVLKAGLRDFKAEFLEGEANLNVAVVVALGLVAFLFLVLEIFALFFGVRISEGIVTGVHALHRGTRAVAGGDLDTVISIPNEDEFGDLAASFNEMTRAVKDGREVALANERLVQELATARAIQLRLLPGGEPQVRGFEVTGASIPSREIGGDYYDFVAQDGDRIGIAIGDVSGKGMPAALLMSNLQASLHGQVMHPGTVAGVVQRVNDLLVKSTDPHMFATFFYGLLEVDTGSFTCTNAGHNPPLLMRTDAKIEVLTAGGLLLGMIGEQVYQQDTVVMAPGEVIVMYTDGITEAVGPSAEEDDPEAMFGEEALHEVLRRHRHLPASGIKDAILAAVATHTHGVPQSDDITLVVIRRQD